MMLEIIEKAKMYALEEIEKFGTPLPEHFELSLKKGIDLAQQLKADSDIVSLGTIFMDLKIGECSAEGKLSEHIQRSSEAAQKFLKPFNLDEEVFKKIVSCIESHHGANPYYCLEAEICANADCHRFLTVTGIFGYLTLLGSRQLSLKEGLGQLEKKMDEKYNIVSLDICRQELTATYNQFKELIQNSRKQLAEI